MQCDAVKGLMLLVRVSLLFGEPTNTFKDRNGILFLKDTFFNKVLMEGLK